MLCDEPGCESTLAPRFYWRIYKTHLMGHFHVGIRLAHFLALMRDRGYDEALVARIATLPNLDNAPLEFCDNFDAHNGTYVRSAFYGLL